MHWKLTRTPVSWCWSWPPALRFFQWPWWFFHLVEAKALRMYWKLLSRKPNILIWCLIITGCQELSVRSGKQLCHLKQCSAEIYRLKETCEANIIFVLLGLAEGSASDMSLSNSFIHLWNQQPYMGSLFQVKHHGRCGWLWAQRHSAGLQRSQEKTPSPQLVITEIETHRIL